MQEILGYWLLTGSRFRRSDGVSVVLDNDQAKGTLVYDDQGNMSVQYINLGRAVIDAQLFEGADPGARVAFEEFLAYFGGYDLLPERGVVIHRLEGCNIGAWVGNCQERSYQLSGDRLVLSTALELPGQTLRCSFHWQRVASSA
jgi:hypothetical protein